MKYCFLSCLIVFAFIARSQDTRTAYIKVDTSLKADALSIPYSEIKILDARFDRTKIGCSYNSIFLTSLSTAKYDTKFPDSFHTYFAKFLNSFVETQPASKDQLIILVKQFRIADHLLRGVQSDFVEIELTLRISASFYALHDNKCYKLFALDNVLLQHIEKPHERKRKFEEGSRSMALRIILYKALQGQKWELNKSQPYFVLSDMETAIQKRFALPLYSQVYRKGIYTSFSDFVNNAPSSENFKIIYDKDQIDHIESGDGMPIASENIWGICDGKKKYLFIRSEFRELIPNDKSFRVYSYATRAELAGSSGGGSLAKLADGAKQQQYFDLNMETGKLYLQEIFGKSSFSFQ